jgi:hypothetical protein
VKRWHRSWRPRYRRVRRCGVEAMAAYAGPSPRLTRRHPRRGHRPSRRGQRRVRTRYRPSSPLKPAKCSTPPRVRRRRAYRVRVLVVLGPPPTRGRLLSRRRRHRRGSVKAPHLAALHPPLFHVKQGWACDPWRPEPGLSRRRYRSRPPCISRPFRIPLHHERFRPHSRTTHAVQRRRVGWRSARTPPIRGPQKRRAASLRRKAA